MTSHSASQEPVAIVGIACEFAGDIHSPTDLWRALKHSEDVGSNIPHERMDLLSYCAHMLNQENDGHLSKSLVHAGYFMSNSQWDTFEQSFFGLSNSEATSIDPAHRLLMLKFVHLLDDAGYTVDQMYGSRTSVHIGQFSGEHALSVYRLSPEYQTRLQGPNTNLYNAAARLAYHFNLHGPNVSLDVACSSSLAAVNMGIQSLWTGESDMAVCGGVNAVYTPESMLSGSLIGAQSPDGRSRSFSIDANGYAKGEGLGLVLLKRLSDAERDGDRIYCLIRDVLSHHDGSEGKSNYVIPSGIGQKRLLVDLYERSETDPQHVFYIEAHGTGTPVGDPIEANALGEFFQRSPSDPPLLIGSLKSNLGHTEGAAGIAALIKAAMSMRHRAIPPNMHFRALNPKIEAQRYNLHVVQHFVPFPSTTGHATLIGINSFGMGGNTTHAIVEEYRPQHKQPTNGFCHHCHEEEEFEAKQHFIFLFSTKCRESLLKQVAQFKAWLQDAVIKGVSDDYRFLARVSKQLLLKRTISYDHLAIFVSADYTQLQKQIDTFLTQQTTSGLLLATRPTLLSRKVCFVYSGQGSQWWAMGRQLYKTEPLFRQWIQRIDAELNKINKDGWQLLNELIEKSNENESRINDTNIAQPALFAIQVALTALLISWRIYPHTIVSHSAGEQAATFVSGRLTLEEAIRIVYHRSRLQNRNTRQGGRMLAVSMSEEQVKSDLLKGIEHLVCVAVVNSSRSVTLSGDEATIDELQQILTILYPDVFKARLRIENAFHSHQMDRFGIQEELLSMLGDIQGLPLQDSEKMFDVHCSEARLYSSVHGGRIDDHKSLDAHHWWTNARGCVRFSDAMKVILEDEVANIFLEISPHPVLATSISECCESAAWKSLILPTLKRKEDEQTTLLTSIAQLTSSPIVWEHYLNSRKIQPTKDDDELFETFPLYAFHKTPCWYESKESVIARLSYRLPSHPLLGVRQWSNQTGASWRSLININLSDHAYLKDHKIQDAILFPGSGYIELALAACRQLIPSSEDAPPVIVFEQIEFINAIILTEHQLTEVITKVIMPMREWFVYSRPWTAASQSCNRTAGMSGTDILNSFDDPQLLNQYSLSEYTLHARGKINMNAAKQLPLLTDIIVDSNLYSEIDPTNVYAHLLSRGYQYGPCSQLIKSIRSTKTTAEAQIDCSKCNGQESSTFPYHLIHPAAIDACLHPALAILPGNFTTFLPVGINRVTIPGGTTTLCSSVCVRAAFYGKIAGLSKQQTYEFDCAITSGDDATEKPVVTFEHVTIQLIQGVQSGRWTQDTSIFDKLNIQMDFPNRDLTPYVDTILADYCLKTVWINKPIATSAVDLLPSSSDILTYHVDSKDDEDLIESIEPFNKLASYYAQMACEQMKNDCTLELEQQQQALFAAIQSLSGYSNENVTFHSMQLYRKQLLDRFPRLQPLLTVLSTCGQHLKQVLTGVQDGLDVLLGNEEAERALQQTQSLISIRQTSLIFDILNRHLRQKHSKSLAGRKLRLFWQGGESDSDALSIILLLLDLCRETDLSINLNYTNSNSTILAKAEETFSKQLATQDRLHIMYNDALDLSVDESNEKIMVESYDIVFAANKLQGNQQLISSLVALRQLLVPNGLLLLLELTDAPLYFDIIFGLFNQWWSSTDNKRALLDIQQWEATIRDVGGFETIQTMSTLFGNSLITAQKSTSSKILQTLEERQRQAWLLFVDNSASNIGNALVSLLPSASIVLIRRMESNCEQICAKIEEMMGMYEQLHIVFGWPLDQASVIEDSEMAFEQYGKEICGIFIRILQTIQAAYPRSFPFVFVVTRNAQPGAGNNMNPIAASLIGLTRSLTLEYEQHRLKLIDLQSTSSLGESSSLVDALVQHLVASRYADNLDEIVLRHDTQTGSTQRMEWHYEMLREKNKLENESVLEALTIIPHRDADQQPFRLQVAPSRFLDDLTWVPDQKIDELHVDEIEVRVHCVGVNFRDVLKARGLYPHVRPFGQTNKEQPLIDRDTEPGSDVVGTVIRSHPNSKVHPGDRIIGMAAGTFHSHIHIHSNQYVRIPDECNHLTDEQLSAMPNVCMTVLYSLKYRLNLQSNQNVLVHAATGGTGQACIQYCQSIGARVIATASSEEKRRCLREQYGLEHVFNSRDLSFVHGIRALLPDGVDVIVNSLSGPLLQESIKLLSSQGHFIEWGKRDIFDKNHLSMFDLRDDCSFHVIDINSLFTNRINLFSKLINEVVQLIVKGVFRPIQPTNVYEPSNVIDVFKKCNSGQMMGKCVLRLTNSQQPLLLNYPQLASWSEGENTMFPSHVCQQGTILISGGCGGLGLTMSRWMIEERGVKRLILMSRRPLSQIAQSNNSEYEEWQRLQQVAKEYNAHVDVVQADVTQFEQIRDLIERINQTSYPVRGIIHTAVVQEDRGLAKLSQDNLIRVFGAKARGAWNLHQASQCVNAPLHFFLLFSSIRNHLIDLASSGYNAGNQFLDVLARYRVEQLHLPALSISLPAVSGAGMFHRHREMLSSLQHTSGFELVPTVGVFELIERFHVDQKTCPCPVIFAANWEKLYDTREKLVTYQMHQIVTQQHVAASNSATSTTSSNRTGTTNSMYDSLETIVERMQTAVARLLGASNVDQIYVDRSLISQGMDSLAAVSLYNWLGQETNVFIPLADLLQGVSIKTVAEQVHKKRNTEKQVNTTSGVGEDGSSSDSMENHAIDASNASHYTGIENVTCIQRPINGDSPILFGIFSNSISDNTDRSKATIDKMFNNQTQMSSIGIYTIDIPQVPESQKTDTLASNMISQMRRIQPCGSYKLVAIAGDHGEVLARQMAEQLETYAIDSIVQLLSI